MNRPFKYSIIDNESGYIYETDIAPTLRELQTFVRTSNPNIFVLKQTKKCYIDTRYEAKLRLYNYVNYVKNGLPILRYEPFKGTEIGISLPILNF